MRITLAHVWGLLVVVTCFVGPASSPIGLPDVWWTIQSGGWMAEHHALLTADPFTSAPPVASVVNLQWLAQLMYWGLEQLGGLELVVAGTAASVALAYGLVLLASVTVSGFVRLSCVAVWTAYLLGFSNLSPRPQTLAYPLFGLFLLAVARAEWRKDTRLLWLLPPATVVWANLHGSFFTGCALLACAALGRSLSPLGRRARVRGSLYAARPYLLALIGCLVAAMITPYGSGSLSYVAGIGSNPIIRDYVIEWAPTTTDWREGWIFFASLGLIGALILRSRTRLTPTEWLILVVFGWLALSSVRAIVWWGLAIAPILSRLLGGLTLHRPHGGREQPLVNAMIAALLVGLGIVSLPWTKNALPILPDDKRGMLSDEMPIAVGEYVRTHPAPPGRMLNHQGWGGYLDRVAWPGHQAFLDGRFELHPSNVWRDYMAIVLPSANWRSLMDRYGFSYAVLSLREEPELVDDLRRANDWRVDYEDGQAVVFIRCQMSDVRCLRSDF
jgi:hypothetical protein